MSSIGCISPERADRPDHLLLVTLDTTRADRIGCYGRSGAGTDWIDSLAARGTRIERAYAQTPITLPSHMSLFTGLHPTRTGIHANGQTEAFPGVRTMAEILSDQGFFTAAAVGGFPLASRFPVRVGFEEYDDRMVDPRNPEGVQRDAGKVVEAALRLLGARGDRRTFLWVHLFDPHDPYEPPAPFSERFRDDPYQGEIARADTALAELMRKLALVLPVEKLLICVVGDHGEGLGDHGEPTHGFFLYEPTIRVPLILAGPGVSGGKVIEGPVQTVDIMPTLLGLLDIPQPDDLDGQAIDLSGSGVTGNTDPVYIETELPSRNYGWSPLRGVVDGDLKYIKAPGEELYDLGNDPDEKNNLALEMPAEVQRLRAWTDEYTERSPVGSAAEEALDPRLMSLGYIGSQADPDDLADLADPKDMLDTYLLFHEAGVALENGEPEKALTHLDELLKREESVGVRFKRAMALRMMGRLDEAARELDTVAETDRSFPGASLERARIAIALKDHRTALQRAEEHLAIYPGHAVAVMFRGAALEMSGDTAGAERDYRRALDINPAYRNASLRLAALLVRSGRSAEARLVLQSHLTHHPTDELAQGLLRSL